MADEHAYARTLTRQLRAAGFFVWKINDNYAGGVPDMYLCGNLGSAWVELKYIKALPKRGTTLVIPALTKQQQLWLRELNDRQQTCRVLVGCGNLTIPFMVPDEWETGLTASQAAARAIPTARAHTLFMDKP